METEQITTHLANVEDGYAEVIDTATGRRIGRVGRDKHGSTRTGVMWTAHVGRHQVAYGYTRTEAVAKLTAHVAFRRARADAFRNA